MRIVLLFVFSLSCFGSLNAQKVEHEYGLSRKEVPARLLHWIDSAYADARGLQLYRDVGEDSEHFEAKFKSGRRKYSIEFDTLGYWSDTEYELRPEEVPREMYSQLCSGYDERFGRYKIMRVQYHRGRLGREFYEIELRSRKDYVWTMHELEIAPDGQILEDVTIELAPGHLDRW